MELPNGTWVVVADGAKYLILENAGTKDDMNLRVRDGAERENPPTHEQGTDRPGRFDDAGHGRSAVADTDWHELAETRFAVDLAERLKYDAFDDRYEHIVIVADPSTLGDLRKALHKEVSNRLLGEIDKDLTNHPVDDMTKVVAEA